MIEKEVTYIISGESVCGICSYVVSISCRLSDVPKHKVVELTLMVVYKY